ncbi:MAG: radical SAM protein [Planctomycetota bacterium]
MMQVREIQAKSLLVKSKLPDAEYVVNPYVGCQFACMYCYASFMGRFVNEPFKNWGNYLYAKTNAVPVFEKDLRRLRSKGLAPSILLSSVTDPYQGAEKKYRLTRGVLEVLVREPYPGIVGILTKSPMVERDIDLLMRLPRSEIGMTVTTTDDRISRFLEVNAPPASRRLKTLAKLHDKGIRTYAFVGPLLPHFRYQPEKLDELFASLAMVGVRQVYVEHMNLRQYIRQRLQTILDDQTPEIQALYKEAASKEHRKALDEIVGQLLKKHGLSLCLDEVLYHNRPATSVPESE